ncbi:MAG TPA: hypothetical protein VF618_12005 [Thermoanaerobaculia bacterium]|jgi:hypothetical protein
MANKREDGDRPYVQLIVLTNSDTGKRVGISAMWLTTFEEADAGTVFKFTNGERVTVEESFREVTTAFERTCRW